MSLNSAIATFEYWICFEVNASGEIVALDVGGGVRFEFVEKFCYLGDMLIGEGGADSAEIAGVRCA